MKSLAERAAEIEEDLEFLEGDEKFEWLIDRGKALQVDAEFTDADLVKGCQSKVWLQVGAIDGKVWIVGTSDALIVKGIVGLLVELFGGASAAEVRSFDFIEWMGRNGLSLSFQRMQGLAGILQRIRASV